MTVLFSVILWCKNIPKLYAHVFGESLAFVDGERQDRWEVKISRWHFSAVKRLRRENAAGFCASSATFAWKCNSIFVFAVTEVVTQIQRDALAS